jgi:hypothetical protein
MGVMSVFMLYFVVLTTLLPEPTTVALASSWAFTRTWFLLHGAEHFLRSYQLCCYSRISQHEESLLCSQPDIAESEVFMVLGMIIKMGRDTCEEHERLVVNY